jgi:hypothetical protein
MGVRMMYLLFCETEGCGSPATSVWSGSYGPPKRACDRHNPMANTAMALPLNFTSRTLCHACGQPVNWRRRRVSAQIRQGLEYIQRRYGAHQPAAIGWYDRGGVLPAGTSRALNGTGEPEQVDPDG